ncbi:MAG TPA: CBS domain-containing protein [Jiangellales bacterium]|jgi:CBS domain-containing protein|nr:CBS domain-containing protein [Jiangellales bacterium]
MRIADVLRGKGDTVVTVVPDITVRDLLALLAEHRIGATVVSTDGARVDGIVSERDVVRAIAARGAAVLSERVADIMTADVRTCTPDTSVDDLMRTMTEGRFRHVPVVVEGRLSGIVSIGDVVKMRIGELETERESLERYISSGSS